MKILIFGVSNVGKTTVGRLLANRLGYSFYDLDDEVKKEYQMTLEEFVHTENLHWRDQKRGRVIKKILARNENMVFAITPISYPDNFKSRIKNADVLAVELIDTAENIFDRLIFSDENDNLYEDNDYKELHRDYFLSDIQEDIEWYGTVYSQIGITNRFKIQNESPEQVVERMILEYNLENIILSGKISGS